MAQKSIKNSNILITGNLGYVGSVLTNLIKQSFIGVDLGWFEKDKFYSQKKKNFLQIKKDISLLNKKELEGIHTIIHLAAISNDPMGDLSKKVTNKNNFTNSKRFFELAVKSGVKRLIFSSSCSVYGFSKKKCNENSRTNPQTAYAQSKLNFENYIKKLSKKNKNVQFIILRFATACGVSERLRLDLVLNDFVANAIITKNIKILSNGKPIRPLIDVEDMSKVIIYFTKKKIKKNFLLLNVGSNNNNYSILNLAKIIQKIFLKKHNLNIKIDINNNQINDNRSYKVDFSKLKKITYNQFDFKNISTTVSELTKLMFKNKIKLKNFRKSNFIRLNRLKKILNEEI
jgi:nucleoside-diphosphate-sugar epimerase